MNEISFQLSFIIGELSLVALIVILTLIDAFQRPIFALLDNPEKSAALESRNTQSSWIAGVGLILVGIIYLFLVVPQRASMFFCLTIH